MSRAFPKRNNGHTGTIWTGYTGKKLSVGLRNNKAQIKQHFAR